VDENIVPVVATVVIVGLPVTAWMMSRILSHRERMAMLQRGYVPSPRHGWGRHRHGWVPPPPGAAAEGPPWEPWSEVESAQRSLRRGIQTTMIGLALLIGLAFIGYQSHGGPFGTPTIVPGPWLLGGLIPTFVGLAQVLVAVLSGARFGPAIPGPQPQPPPQPPPARPVRPGDELPSPLRPPERR
jgi:hypothetical protein